MRSNLGHNPVERREELLQRRLLGERREGEGRTPADSIGRYRHATNLVKTRRQLQPLPLVSKWYDGLQVLKLDLDAGVGPDSKQL